MHRVIPYRTVALGLLVVAVAAGVLVARSHHGGGGESDTAEIANCPASAPSACYGKLARIWNTDARQLPTITPPPSMRFTRGFIAKKTIPPAVFFTFDTFVGGNARPSEISMKITPASSAALKAPKGATMRALPGGRPYVDASGAQRSGPFVERVGGYEVVISFDPSPDPALLRPAKLALLAAVADPA